MKKIPLIILPLLCLTLCCGCGIDKDLPADPTAFQTGSFTNPADPEDGYLSIEYNGRVYIPYGTLRTRLTGRDVGPCLGYTVQDGEPQTDVRIFLLNADPEANFLLRMAVNGIMEQPDFFRATDTAGKNVPEPDCIESLHYAFWE